MQGIGLDQRERDRENTLTCSNLKARLAIFLWKAHFSPVRVISPCPKNRFADGLKGLLSNDPPVSVRIPFIISGSDTTNLGIDPNQHSRVFPYMGDHSWQNGVTRSRTFSWLKPFDVDRTRALMRLIPAVFPKIGRQAGPRMPCFRKWFWILNGTHMTECRTFHRKMANKETTRSSKFMISQQLLISN